MPSTADLDAPLDPDALGDAVAEVVAVVGPLYRRVARTVESAEPLEGLSTGVRSVLELLASGPRPVPRIAEVLALSRQFVQRMVNDAAEAGLVLLEPNPAHSRSPIVALTEEGGARIEAVKAREHAIMSGIGGDFTARELDTSLRVLRQVLSHFAPGPDDDADGAPARAGRA